jgi:hypothetical protein
MFLGGTETKHTGPKSELALAKKLVIISILLKMKSSEMAAAKERNKEAGACTLRAAPITSLSGDL